jgi:hypothetical protein
MRYLHVRGTQTYCVHTGAPSLSQPPSSSSYVMSGANFCPATLLGYNAPRTRKSLNSETWLGWLRHSLSDHRRNQFILMICFVSSGSAAAQTKTGSWCDNGLNLRGHRKYSERQISTHRTSIARRDAGSADPRRRQEVDDGGSIACEMQA